MMAEPRIVTARCQACGAGLESHDAACPACAEAASAAVTDQLEETASEVGLVTDLPPEECATGPLWVRISAATVYAIVGLLCVAGSVTFFMEQHLGLSDVVFGVMAVGLAVIAVFGVKESLFPSDWRPE
ncbi:MAG: hypothetical protein IPF53_11580 [Blastocatellia bacterium]|jgi:anti-sigma factor RsiW|nr:hypothetical protein [Blastocatellia bacterium]MBK6428138.1 hypothetical protein [Blastocatellia bacterium]